MCQNQFKTEGFLSNRPKASKKLEQGIGEAHRTRLLYSVLDRTFDAMVAKYTEGDIVILYPYLPVFRHGHPLRRTLVVIRNAIPITATLFLLGCTTVSEWQGDYSPTKKECWPNATYFVGSRAALVYAAELDGQGWRLIDLPFSFAGDVLLLPISIPAVNNRKTLCYDPESPQDLPAQ